MTKVYICDDESVWIEQIEHAVSDFIVSSDWALSVVCKTTLPNKLLSCLLQNETLGGIYFLDIILKSEINGIELGAKIRELDPEAVLIFVTTHDELVMDTFRFKLQATDYILKDSGNLRAQIYSTFRTLEARYDNSIKKLSTPRICLYTGSSYHFINKNDIYYIESQKNRHKLFVHMRSEVFTISTSLKDLEKQLGDDFIVCRRGCIVNLSHIVEVNRSTKEIIFDNKEICYCSHRAWRLVVEKYLDN